MDTILVIGAGKGQIPLINLIHGYGYRAAVVSPEGDYPGLKLADDILFEDVRAIEKIIEYARRINVCAVLTDQLDVGVLTVAKVAEALNLKGIGVDVAEKFTDKYLMRKEAEKIGIDVPFAVKVATLEEAKKSIQHFRFPIMMKPIDSDASRGVYKISNFNELEKKFSESQSYSKTKEVILEEFVVGKEYVVESFTNNFETTNLAVGYRDYFSIKDSFIPSGTVFLDADSANDELERRLKEINKKIVKAFKLPFGITHAEYLYNQKEDKIYLVEIAARGGGVFISSDLIPLATGVNINDLLLRTVLKMPIPSKITLRKGASAYFCFLLPEGIIENIRGIDELQEIQGINKTFLEDVKIGERTKPILNKGSRKGPIIVEGAGKKDCYEVIKKVKEKIDIKLLNTEGKIESIIWD